MIEHDANFENGIGLPASDLREGDTFMRAAFFEGNTGSLGEVYVLIQRDPLIALRWRQWSNGKLHDLAEPARFLVVLAENTHVVRLGYASGEITFKFRTPSGAQVLSSPKNDR